jgi:voltage-gated potassium channel
MFFVKMANSVAALMVTWFALLFGSAVAYSAVEDSSLLDVAYWSIVTATTLGYGDLSPHTVEGKVLTAFLISVTVFFLIPTITANLASKLIVNRYAFTHEEQEELKVAVRALLDRYDAMDAAAIQRPD